MIRVIRVNIKHFVVVLGAVCCSYSNAAVQVVDNSIDGDWYWATPQGSEGLSNLMLQPAVIQYAGSSVIIEDNRPTTTYVGREPYYLGAYERSPDPIPGDPFNIYVSEFDTFYYTTSLDLNVDTASFFELTGILSRTKSDFGSAVARLSKDGVDVHSVMLNNIGAVSLDFMARLEAGLYKFEVEIYSLDSIRPPSGVLPRYHVGEIEGTFDYQLTISEVPLPAAVWFFASAFLGLTGLKNLRKTR